MKKSIVFTALLAMPALLAAADSQPVAKSGRIHAPIIVRERHGSQVSSTNWSGYAVTGAKGSVTDVKASWVLPQIQGTCPSTNQYSSFWVGIDGYSSNTVEQIGTDSDCVNGQPTYYAWFEFYPHPSININSVPVAPGDAVYAEVQSTGKGTFTVTITNVTTGATFTGSAKVPSADQSSAEWIAEAPYSGGVLPLAHFGTVDFGFDYSKLYNYINFAKLTDTCYATIGSWTGPIGLPQFNANLDSITMDGSAGNPKAVPSSLSDGTSFSIAWSSSQ